MIMTTLKELSNLFDKMIMYRVDQIINEDNEWFDELIDKKIQERIDKNGTSTT